VKNFYEDGLKRWELEEIIDSPERREIKRALAVKRVLLGFDT